MSKSVGACFDMSETHMLKVPWVVGNAYTISDAYLRMLRGLT